MLLSDKWMVRSPAFMVSSSPDMAKSRRDRSVGREPLSIDMSDIWDVADTKVTAGLSPVD
jgi:hypothetical protein